MAMKKFSHIFVILVSLQSTSVALDKHPIGIDVQTDSVDIMQFESVSVKSITFLI